MSSFSDLVNQLSKGSVKEAAKPKALKLGKSFKVESRVEHPTKGQGVITSLTETTVGVRWDRFDLRILGEDKLGAAEAKHLVVVEAYEKDSKKATVGKKAVKKIDAKKKKVAKGKKKVTEAIAAIPGVFVGQGTRKPAKESLVLDAFDLGLLEADEEAPAASTGGDVGNNDLNNDNVEDAPVTTNNPLSTEGGFESASEGGEDNLEMPDDALDTINWKRMESPGQGNTRSAPSGGDASAGNGSKETSFGKGDSGSKPEKSEKSDSDEGESKESKFEQNKFKKTDESKKAKPTYRTLTEGMTLADADIEHILVECNDDRMMDECTGGNMMGDGIGGMPTSAPKQLPNPSMMNEHNMAAGEIAVTQEFLVKLLKAAVKYQLADDKLSVVAQAVAECCNEDRTLDVADIATVMGKLKELAGGAGAPAAAPVAPAASMDAPAEAPAEEPAEEPDFGGDEGSEEAPAEEPDFGGDEGSEDDSDEGREEPAEEPARDEGSDDAEGDSDEGSDESDDEGSEEKDNEFEDKAEGDGEVAGAEGGEEHEGKTKLMSGQHKPWEKDEEKKDEVKESRRKKVAKTKKALKEAWMAPIQGMSPNAAPQSVDGLRDEEKELAMIRRRAGLQNWWKN